MEPSDNPSDNLDDTTPIEGVTLASGSVTNESRSVTNESRSEGTAVAANYPDVVDDVGPAIEAVIANIDALAEGSPLQEYTYIRARLADALHKWNSIE